ncbi:Retrovirus-related Pol polyprotein from transposon 17.6 [Eumeta japonica]|uniref:Retrovirus-related Pol polyprotein from transposon 17.6 n=1 Tax=Eumeta variegata TaxID=151549 RepID=A0A4C2A3T3_EUMVA|nr:Retrovirus-related Pol polyprotein from transposon 17.6 [Eumeta japonica]
MSDITNPLKFVTKKHFIWEIDDEEALTKIQSPPGLRLYDVNKPVTLCVDASSKNLGAAFLQEGQPIAYGARALTKSEDNYPQIEKEALAIQFGYFQQLKGQCSYEVIEQLKRWLTVHGIPEELQMDNGTQYMSEEFKIFLKSGNLTMSHPVHITIKAMGSPKKQFK